MDHGQALATNASERYLLGEMSEPEKYDFEGHYFGCEACAEDVRSGVLLARGIKAVCAMDEKAMKSAARPVRDTPRRTFGWFDWLTPAAFAPSAAAVAFAVVAGYQAFLVIPGLRMNLAPQAMAGVVLHAAARGEEPEIEVDKTTGVSILAMDVTTGDPGQPIAWELTPPEGSAVVRSSTKVPAAGAQLELFVANATLHEHPGAWTLRLRTLQGAEVASYPFRIKIK